MSASWDLQKAVYTALASNVAFMASIGNRLYDEPQTDEIYPYVVIGEGTEVSDNDLNTRGFEDTIVLRIFTKPGGLGFYTAKTVQALADNVLNVKRLPMDNYTMSNIMLEISYTERDDDIRIVNARYRAHCYSNTQIIY